MTTEIAIRRLSWLQSFRIRKEEQTTIKDFPFEGNEPFNNRTDEAFCSLKDLRECCNVSLHNTPYQPDMLLLTQGVSLVLHHFSGGPALWIFSPTAKTLSSSTPSRVPESQSKKLKRRSSSKSLAGSQPSIQGLSQMEKQRFPLSLG